MIKNQENIVYPIHINSIPDLIPMKRITSPIEYVRDVEYVILNDFNLNNKLAIYP